MRKATTMVGFGVALSIMVGLGGSAWAQQGALLGARTVADLSETDVIAVPGGQSFSSIRLCVAQRAVRFRDLDIVFANGASQDASVQRRINAGECTRWIDLAGQRRNIARIVMRYDTLNNVGMQAIVTAFGRR